MILHLYRAAALGLTMLAVAHTAHADLIFAAPPRESVEEAKAVYDPFAAYLSELIGERVTYEHPHTWTQYTTLMREGHYDVVFDGPHFAAWRFKHLNHAPVAALPGTLSFVYIVKAADTKVQSLKDLSSAQFCTLPKPNFATIVYLSEFASAPIRPEIMPIKGGFDDIVTALKAGRCRAAVVRDNVWEKLPADTKSQFKVVQKSGEFPNQTLTVSARIKPEVREKLSAALATKTELGAAKGIFDENSKKDRFFVRTHADSYRSAEPLLETEWAGAP